LSHKPPGLIVHEQHGICNVNMEVKNYGKTPARITNVIVKSITLPDNAKLPDVPDYAVDQHWVPTTAFLVANDGFLFTRSFSVPELWKVKTRQLAMYVFGYVDYIDKFWRRHRSGYGRGYGPQIDNPASHL
jgi:hypothetical protein